MPVPGNTSKLLTSLETTIATTTHKDTYILTTTEKFTIVQKNLIFVSKKYDY
jgi:hypothetical protein